MNGNVEDRFAYKYGRASDQSKFISGWYASKYKPTYFFNHRVAAIVAYEGEGFFGMKLYESKKNGHARYKKREFVQAQFNTPLVAGETYYLSFALALHETSRWTLDNLGIVFGNTNDNLLSTTDLHMREPDIRLNQGKHVGNYTWQRYYVRYVAKGGEQSLVFGAFGEFAAHESSFRNHVKDGYENAAMYYIDDFRLTEEMQDNGCFYSDVTTIQQPKRLSLILDFSGSMKKNKSIDAVQAGVIEAIKDYKSIDQINIVGFATTSKLLYSGPKSQLSTDSLARIIDECRLAGATNVLGGLKRGIKEAEDQLAWDSDKMILVSDGAFTLTSALKSAITGIQNKELYFVHVGKDKKNHDDLKALGVKYIKSSNESLTNDFTRLARTNLFANTCELFIAETRNKGVSVIIDNSGSMDGNKDDLRNFLSSFLVTIHPNVPMQLVRASTEGTDEIFSGKRRQLSKAKIDKIVNQMQYDGYDEWEKGIGKAMTHYGNELSHHSLLITDYSPLDYDIDDYFYFDDEVKSNKKDLFALYINESDEKFELMRFSPTKERFVRHTHRSSAPEFVKFLFAPKERFFQSYERSISSRTKKRHSIKRYRKSLKLHR